MLGIRSVTSTFIAAYYSEEMFYAMPCSGLSYKYYKNKMLSEVPEGISKCIAWNKNEPLELPIVDQDLRWKLLQKNK